MNITMLTFGTRGDVQPLVALGLTLRARGHSVAIGTAPGFEELVTGSGLDFRAVVPPPGMREDLFSQPKLNAAVRKSPGFVRTVRSVTPPTDEEIVGMFTGMAAATEDADLVVTAPVTHIAGFVGDKPWCSVSWIPANKTREFPAYQAKPRLGGGYNRLTHRFYDTFQWTSACWMANKYFKATGGQAMGGKSRFAEMGRDRPMLYPFSAAVVPPPADWPERAHITGYWFYDRPEWTPSPELASFTDGTAPVLLTLGSTWPFHDADTTVDHAVAAARAARKPLLVVGGPDRDYPDDVHRATEVDYGWLMPRCSAVVHHGGCGTAGAALRAGVPQVSIPAVFDNPFWATRMHALGVSATPVPLTKLTREALTSAVAAAVGDAGMRARAVETGARMAGEKGLTTAADIVEQWHAESVAAV
jgi:UDP:flavonoid glycosyltransferase YjiC (YdhE family)